MLNFAAFPLLVAPWQAPVFPMQIFVNGEAQEVPVAASVFDLIAKLGLVGKRIAVERNGDIVPRSLHANTALIDGDKVEIVVAVGGG